MATALMDELVEEVLVRLPPDDPTHLFRAALVCKRWCRLVSALGFRRRLLEFHHTAPVLGVLCNSSGRDEDLVYQDFAWFVPNSSSFRLRRAHGRRGRRALDACHGRVLLRSMTRMSVWDPITGREQELPPVPRCSYIWNGAVLCGGGGGGDCDHLDCHTGPFLVVVVGTARCRSRQTVFVDVYSSKANAWIEEASSQHINDIGIPVDSLQPSVFVGNALYFMLRSHTEILEYKLCTREISKIQLPPMFDRPKPKSLIITTDGRLGFAMLHDSKVHLWVREAGPEGDAGWTQRRIIELEKLLPADARLNGASAVGFVDGANLIFVETDDGLFAIDLKLRLARRVWKCRTREMVIPYVSFYTPAIGIRGKDEKPRDQ
ncbi:unnamed protein product [Urochloa decumbens]|uniref:F-box domain-containing protein n=1 Tax=Urochloa decumbens TaxID=240449 RepID=A0ABC9H4I9_9POAL